VVVEQKLCFLPAGRRRVTLSLSPSLRGASHGVRNTHLKAGMVGGFMHRMEEARKQEGRHGRGPVPRRRRRVRTPLARPAAALPISAGSTARVVSR
jgi:hypothetical protein